MSTDLSPSPLASSWQRFAAGAVRAFHSYANWLVGISWKRFVVLSILLMILASVLQGLPPFSSKVIEIKEMSEPVAPPSPPATPSKSSKSSTPHPPGVTIDKSGVHIVPGLGSKDDAVSISVDETGVRITPRARVGQAASAASQASAAASAGPVASVKGDGSVQINLPPGATSEAVRQAVEQARDAVVDAIEESRRAEIEAAADAAETAAEVAATTGSGGKGSKPRVTSRIVVSGDPLDGLAFLFIVASAILKITYKGRMQAEVKAAVATETAESEQLKRQVVEARMAAMQAQVEPHFLFNTLASIDHLIETDPPRASQMQKNLIALLRASMPTMRESHPTAHNLGREIAVIRPYLEILKVRMEERLQTVVDVPEGLLSADFPSMMIQSLVENAIKHGLEPKPEGGTLTVRAEVQHGKLAVTVADTGVGFGKAATAGTGVGLANIRERLQLLYGNKASMTVAENTPSGTVVTLTVPYQAQTREGENA